MAKKPSGTFADPVINNAGLATVEPSTVTGDTTANSGSGDAPVRRTRKPRSDAGKPRTRRAPAKKTTGVIGIEKILYSLHLMAASAVKVDELALDEAEAKALADAVTEVASHYDITPDPKIMAWAGLIGVCSSIYAPRIMAYKLRTATAKRDVKEHAKPMAQKVEEAKPSEHDPISEAILNQPMSNLQ